MFTLKFTLVLNLHFHIALHRIANFLIIYDRKDVIVHVVVHQTCLSMIAHIIRANVRGMIQNNVDFSCSFFTD